ncbi:MAG: hypothetical protein ACRC2T_16885, partial [Thermoguttaceae bacterium]
MTPQQKKRWFWICLVGSIVALFLGFVGMNLIPIPLQISKETTYITEPRTSDGKYIDYFRAIEQLKYPPEMRTDDNGFRLIVQKLDPIPSDFKKSLPSDQQILVDQICEKLGLDPNKLGPPIPFEIDFESILSKYARDNYPNHDSEIIMKRIRQCRGTPEETKMITDWIEANSPALDVVVEAAEKPVFCIPYFRDKKTNELEALITLILPNVQDTRSCARNLRTRAEYRLSNGDVNGAIDDTNAILRLGRGVGHIFFVEVLVGISLEGIANAAPIMVSAEYQPSEEQIAKLQHAIQNLPPRCELSKIMQGERYMVLSAGQMLAAAKDVNIDARELADMLGLNTANFFLLRMPLNWNTVMKQLNKHFDSVEDGAFDPSSLSGGIPPGKIVSALLSRNTRGWLAGDMLTTLFLPASDACKEAL